MHLCGESALSLSDIFVICLSRIVALSGTFTTFHLRLPHSTQSLQLIFVWTARHEDNHTAPNFPEAYSDKNNSPRMRAVSFFLLLLLPLVGIRILKYRLFLVSMHEQDLSDVTIDQSKLYINNWCKRNNEENATLVREMLLKPIIVHVTVSFTHCLMYYSEPGSLQR